MSKTIVILGHPNLEESLVNKPIKEALKDEEDILYKDLNELYKNREIDVEKEQQDLLNAEKIVLQFPLYWYNVPSKLKEWIDSVFAYGFVYEINNQGNFQALALQGKEFQMIATMGANEENYQRDDTLSVDKCLETYTYTANLLGMKVLETYKVYGISMEKFSQDRIDSIIQEVKEAVL